MKSKHWKLIALMIMLGLVVCAIASAQKGRKKTRRSSAAKAGEPERKVTEAEVPAAALATLKKLARRAEITEFAEEIEHGHTFYEGSWRARSGADMDVLVTTAGALVEIEERVAADKVPAAVRKAARKAAGKRVQLAFEKKTMILYEVKFQRDDSRHELLLSPDGRRVEEEVEKGDPDGDDEDEGNEDEREEDEDDEDDEYEDEDEDDKSQCR